jgi:hypothetical protein
MWGVLAIILAMLSAEKIINTGHNNSSGYGAFKYEGSKRAFSINIT